ncbi:MAG TPA: DUF6279 family lipoprotein [Burkholderiaceae bacterium]|nr:DUF6279 family lipoprotein [Burkholderiaceae bacterium]
MWESAGNRSIAFARHVARRVAAASCAAALVVLPGCTAVRIGYDNADTLLVYTFDNYLDLDDAQADFLRQRARALLDWHRASQLPDYVRTLEGVEAQVSGGAVEPADVLGFIRLLDDRLVAIGEQAAPDLAQLAATLQPAQVDRLQQKLAVEAAKSCRPQDHRDDVGRRVERFADRASSWFGGLTAPQLDLVRASMEARPEAARDWCDEVDQRGRDLAALVRRIGSERPDEAQAAAWVRDYVASLPSPADPARRAFLEDNRRANAALIAQLIQTSSARQRAALKRRLAQYVEDFSALAIERVRDGGPG